MNGKIDKMGILWINRGGKQKAQRCPSSDATFNRICGDECPLFGEPKPDYDVDVCTGEVKPTSKTTLQLCHKTLVFDVLVDERCE